MPLSLHKKSPTNQRLQFVSCGLEQLQFKQPQHQKRTPTDWEVVDLKLGHFRWIIFGRGGEELGLFLSCPHPSSLRSPQCLLHFFVYEWKKKSHPVIPRSWFRVLNWTLATFRLNVAPWTKSSMQPAEETWVIFQITPLSKLSHF